MALALSAIHAATQLLVGKQELSIDNKTFKLFYLGSVAILITSSVLVSFNQLFGDPIQCDLPRGGVNDGVLKAYCWMYSTFNIPPEFEGNCARTSGDSDKLVYNSYYQWVPIFLVLQAILFYVPRALWLTMEGGLMKYLAKGRTDRLMDDSDLQLRSLLSTFRINLRNKYNRYALVFFSCEALNLLVVLAQFAITHRFLQGQFLFYGWEVYKYYQLPAEEAGMRDLVNPMCRVFPRVASCTYWKYGGAGRQTGLNAMCILALNIVIDKIYLVIWIWFVFLCLVGGFRVLTRIFLVVCPRFRYYSMKMKMYRYFKHDTDMDEMKSYLISCSIGDWFVLYQMSKNLNRRFFHQFLIQLSKDVKTL